MVCGKLYHSHFTEVHFSTVPYLAAVWHRSQKFLVLSLPIVFPSLQEKHSVLGNSKSPWNRRGVIAFWPGASHFPALPIQILPFNYYTTSVAQNSLLHHNYKHVVTSYLQLISCKLMRGCWRIYFGSSPQHESWRHQKYEKEQKEGEYRDKHQVRKNGIKIDNM